MIDDLKKMDFNNNIRCEFFIYTDTSLCICIGNM